MTIKKSVVKIGFMTYSNRHTKVFHIHSSEKEDILLFDIRVIVMIFRQMFEATMSVNNGLRHFILSHISRDVIQETKLART